MNMMQHCSCSPTGYHAGNNLFMNTHVLLKDVSFKKKKISRADGPRVDLNLSLIWTLKRKVAQNR